MTETNVVWLRPDVVLSIHLRLLSEHGGREGIRDEGLLLSALDRPKNFLAYGQPDIADLAAAYAYGITRNHPFIDGNKRVALVLCRTFLLLNGYDLEAALDEKYAVFMRLARGELDEGDLAAWIRERISVI